MKRFLSAFVALFILFSVSSAFAADPVPVESISLGETSVNLPIKKVIRLNAVISPKNATNKKLTWSSSDESVAKVSANGSVTGISTGTATITAAAQDGSSVSASVTVNVVIPVKKITLSETKTLSLAAWSPWKITATVAPFEATLLDIVWSSSNEDVAKVDQDGVVTGISKGTAKITATAADGSNTKASVDVKIEDFDLVFKNKSSQTVTYYYGSGYILVNGSVKTGCVKIPNIETSILALIGKDVHKEQVSVTPVKPGADVVTISAGGRKFKYKVFVSPSAFPSSEVAPAQENAEGSTKSSEILFLDIPWGSSYSEAKSLLGKQDNTLKALAQRNDYLRAMLKNEVPFSNLLTAYSAGMNFTYESEDPDFKDHNSFFKGDLYFDPEIPFDQVKIAVRNVYHLDQGESSKGTCTWQQNDVTLKLTEKEKYTILEISRNNE